MIAWEGVYGYYNAYLMLWMIERKRFSVTHKREVNEYTSNWQRQPQLDHGMKF